MLTAPIEGDVVRDGWLSVFGEKPSLAVRRSHCAGALLGQNELSMSRLSERVTVVVVLDDDDIRVGEKVLAAQHLAPLVLDDSVRGRLAFVDGCRRHGSFFSIESEFDVNAVLGKFNTNHSHF